MFIVSNWKNRSVLGEIKRWRAAHLIVAQFLFSEFSFSSSLDSTVVCSPSVPQWSFPLLSLFVKLLKPCLGDEWCWLWDSVNIISCLLAALHLNQPLTRRHAALGRKFVYLWMWWRVSTRTCVDIGVVKMVYECVCMCGHLCLWMCVCVIV